MFFSYFAKIQVVSHFERKSLILQNVRIELGLSNTTEKLIELTGYFTKYVSKYLLKQIGG